jgi:integrase
MDRAPKGSVVLEARLGKEDGYRTVDVDIKKGQPVPFKGATSFYARYTGPQYTTNKGRISTRYRKPLGQNLANAWVTAQNIELQLHAAKLGQTIPSAEPPVIEAKGTGATIAGAVKEFITYSEGRVNDWRSGGDNGLSPNSLVAYKKAVTNFADACAEMGAVSMDEFRDDHRGEAILLNFKRWLDNKDNVKRRAGKSAYSNARKFTIISQFLARNGFKMKTDRRFNPNDPGLLDHADMPRVKKPGIGDVVYYTPADLRAMLKAAERVVEANKKGAPPRIYLADDLKDLLLTLLWTGMRDEEIQHLTWADINWKNGDGKGKITVQDHPEWDWRVKDHEKRHVEMPDKLRTRLKARLEMKGTRAPRHHNKLIFPTSAGTPNQNFADHVGDLQRRAEEGGYAFSRPETRKHILHNFRKSYATYQMLMGIPVRNIQRDLGHSDLATTERYLAVVDEPAKVRKDFEKID